MSPRVACFAVLFGAVWSETALAAPPAVASLNDLSMEVDALLTLQRFGFTATQREALRPLAARTSMKSVPQAEGTADPVFRKVLEDLRSALLQSPVDLERIDDLEETLNELRDGVERDDAVTITESARQRAPELLRRMSARQMASYLAALDDVPDPLEELLEALDKAAELNDTDWKEACGKTIVEVSGLLGGLEPKAVRASAQQVLFWLQQVHAARGPNFVKRRPELEAAARRLASQAPPSQVLRHVAERGLAELLSNPRLSAALEAYPRP